MGDLQAHEMAYYADLRSGLTWHLSANHYPPVPLSMLKPCIEAIDAAKDEEWETLIGLPEGVTWRNLDRAPAWAIVEQHHLDAWI